MDGFDGNIASLLSRLWHPGPCSPLSHVSEQFPGSCGMFLCGYHSCLELERAVGMPVAGLPTSPLSAGLGFAQPEGLVSSNREERK